MPKLAEVCRFIRSKNAGPFWITVDLFFKDDASYRTYASDPVLSAELFHRLYGVKQSEVKFFRIDSLNTVKISYPRVHPQGWRGERDMHSGQQCYPLLNIELC
jgi:Domain of unknown function (DUF4387)